MAKERLDVLVVNNGLAESRERAKALIMEGKIFVDGVREDKPGTKFDTALPIELRGESLKYVSRGGLKLERAIEFFPIELTDRICMDIGASTGGFTDCMLSSGAKKVYSIDVGYGQLAWKLRNDPRVVCMEKTNFRYLKREELECPDDDITFSSVDVSFISLEKILPAVSAILRGSNSDEYEIVCLVKPQFEAGRAEVGKKGVVRDPKVHEGVINRVIAYAGELGLYACGLTHSPIKGPEGNIEYLLYLKPNRADAKVDEKTVRLAVEASHAALDHP